MSGLVWDPLLRRYRPQVERAPVIDLGGLDLDVLAEGELVTRAEAAESRIAALRAQLRSEKQRLSALHQRLQVLEARKREAGG